jgi:hypothetical protein
MGGIRKPVDGSSSVRRPSRRTRSSVDMSVLSGEGNVELAHRLLVEVDVVNRDVLEKMLT